MQVIGIAGWKNSGKTGLVERLVAEITACGITVSTVKHAHHDADIDQPGRDSYRHREAGAREVLLSTGKRWALMHELRGEEEPPLEALLARLSPVDLVLVEGFKRSPHPKIEAHRAATGQGLLAAEDPTIIAIASDSLKGVAPAGNGPPTAARVSGSLLEPDGMTKARSVLMPSAANPLRGVRGATVSDHPNDVPPQLGEPQPGFIPDQPGGADPRDLPMAERLRRVERWHGDVPVFHLDDTVGIAAFILAQAGLGPR